MEKDITISLEQSDLAFNFLKHLFSDSKKDTQNLWDCISKVDQARIYGMYSDYVSQVYSEKISFRKYVEEYIKPDIVELFLGLKDNNPGIATHTRNTKEGEVTIYMLPDVKVSRTYIAESPEYVFPIHMTIDTNLKYDEITHEWKIRIYTDQDYKNLK